MEKNYKDKDLSVVVKESDDSIVVNEDFDDSVIVHGSPEKSRDDPYRIEVCLAAEDNNAAGKKTVWASAGVSEDSKAVMGTETWPILSKPSKNHISKRHSAPTTAGSSDQQGSSGKNKGKSKIGDSLSSAGSFASSDQQGPNAKSKIGAGGAGSTDRPGSSGKGIIGANLSSAGGDAGSSDRSGPSGKSGTSASLVSPGGAGSIRSFSPPVSVGTRSFSPSVSVDPHNGFNQHQRPYSNSVRGRRPPSEPFNFYNNNNFGPTFNASNGMHMHYSLVPPPQLIYPTPMVSQGPRPNLYPRVPSAHGPRPTAVHVPAPTPPRPPPNPYAGFQIRNQVEYYFSVDNLVKDEFLRRNMDLEGWVPIELVANFAIVRRLKQNTKFEDVNNILALLRYSPLLEVKDRKIRRRHGWERWPLPPH